MAVEDDNLNDETLLQVCRLSADHDELTPELLEDLKAVRSLVGLRRTADGRLEHAVALLVSALGSFTLHNPRHLPFGYSGPTVRSKNWVAKETVERTLIQIAGLIWTDAAPTVAATVQRAVSQSVSLGFVEQSKYDAWEPGMATGSGWRDVLSATHYGVTKARKLTASLRGSVAAVPQAAQVQSDVPRPPVPFPTTPPAADDSVKAARRKRLDAEHRAFREQVRREHDEIVRDAASARTKGDVPAILNQLIGEISLWTRQLKHETLVLFDDTEEARLNRRMMKNEPGGISLLPGYIMLGFSVAPDARDLVELAVGNSQAASLIGRMKDLDDVKHEFAVAVATLASSWDEGDEKDYNTFALLDEHRSSVKLSAFELCRYIETLAHLVSSRTGASQAPADSNGNSGRRTEESERPTTSRGDARSAPADSAKPDPVKVWAAAETVRTVTLGLSIQAILMQMGKESDFDDREKMSNEFKMVEQHGYLLVSVARQLSLDPQPLIQILQNERLWSYPNEKADVAVFRAVTTLAEHVITEARVWCAEAGIDLAALIEAGRTNAPDPKVDRPSDTQPTPEQPAATSGSPDGDFAGCSKNGTVPKMDPTQARIAGQGILLLLAQTYYKLLEDSISLASWCTSLDMQLNHAYLWTVKNITNLLKNDKELADFPEPFKPLLADLYPSTIGNLEWQDMMAPQAEGFLSAVQQYVIAKGYAEPEEKSQAWVFMEVFRPGVEDALKVGREYHERMRQHVKQLLGKPSKSRENGAGQADTLAPTASAKPTSGNSTASNLADDGSNRATVSGSATDTAPTLKIGRRGEPSFVSGKEKSPLTDAQHDVLVKLQQAGEAGMTKDELELVRPSARRILDTLRSDADWAAVILMAGKTNGRYRIRQ